MLFILNSASTGVTLIFSVWRALIESDFESNFESWIRAPQEAKLRFGFFRSCEWQLPKSTLLC